jgi:hypothetical protein
MTDLVETFIIPLEAACLPYVITGSVAAMAYGEPRLTNDIDLILELNASSVSILESAFPEPDYYRPPTELILIETARNQRGHFNLIHNDSMLKADVYLVSADPLHRWALARRRRLDLGGVTASFAPRNTSSSESSSSTRREVPRSTSPIFARCFPNREM